ncbi:hypothetical protein GA0116948_10736 [Chitinophaga costaii]|uniref:Prolipoprotein diacylglyceryl transferase n=1 Tax=Chitinophaga costaii TaxID=1335309 RepID=A0A1C4E221_9BACT|nr:hypothetical protein GA0116948_10736 [Chitinophaga costaii]
MIQWLSYFLKRFRYVIGFLFGLIVCIITIRLSILGITSYLYYDPKRYEGPIHIPVVGNYIIGVGAMALSFRRS